MKTSFYRGKRIDGEGWVFGYLIGEDVIVGDVVEFNDEYFNTEYWYKVHQETVGRYLRDGIFEHDILPYHFVITYIDADDQSNLGMDIGWYEQRDNFESWRLLTVGEEFEVLGNIHDNPELLNNST